MNKNKLEKIIIVVSSTIMFLLCVYLFDENNTTNENTLINNKISYELSNIPKYNGETYVEINNNIPQFTTDDMNLKSDYYSNLEDGKARNGNDKNFLEKSK